MFKSKKEKITFSLIMAFMMTYAMELYNLSLMEKGLHNALFIEVFKDVFFMAIIVIILQEFIGGPFARHFAHEIFNANDKPIFMTICIQTLTVMCMCPMMSLVATILFKNPGVEIVSVWLQTMALNLPMAFFWQLLFAGPFVRFVMRKLF